MSNKKISELVAYTTPVSGDVLPINDSTPTTKKITVDNLFNILSSLFRIKDSTDPTKKVAFDVSGVTAATTRTITIPDANTTMVGTDTTQTLSGKTLTSPIINLGSDAEGDTYYRNSSGVLVRLPRGTDNYIYKMNGNVPNWEAETTNADATSTVAGIVELATAAEINAGTATGGDGPLVVTPDQFKDSLFGLGAGYFGDGSDGNVTISANTDLTRDMNYANLTVNSTFTLNTKGYRVFVSGTLTNNGTISNDGSAGSGVTGGAGGAAGTLLGGGSGANSGGLNSGGGGGGGGGIVFVSAYNVAVQGTVRAMGGDGANGAIPSAGNSNGTAGTTISRSLIQSGTGGTGGNCNGQTGAAGGVITTNSKMSPKIYSLVNLMFDGVAQLAGGAGGGSAGESVTNASAGGGGGGQGGVVVFFYRFLTTAGTLSAAGGAGGSGAGTGGLSGSSGSSGLTISVQI